MNSRRSLLLRLAPWLAVLLFVVLPPVAGAHASLIRSDPANGALHSPAVGRVTAWFDLPLQAEQSTIQVFDSAGVEVDAGDGRVDPGDLERKSMIVSLHAPLPAGAYVVHWHALSDEGLHTGHITEGEFSFWVADSGGLLHPGWVLAGLAVLGGLVNAVIILRARAG